MNKFLLIILMLSLSPTVWAQDAIARVWYNAEKSSKIKVYQGKDGKFYGKIVWLKDPHTDGKARTDINNPSAHKRRIPLLGLIILKGLEKSGEDYEDGKIYDPKEGKTYSCKAKLVGKELQLRGYIGISLIGRTTTWTPAEE